MVPPNRQATATAGWGGRPPQPPGHCYCTGGVAPPSVERDIAATGCVVALLVKNKKDAPGHHRADLQQISLVTIEKSIHTLGLIIC